MRAWTVPLSARRGLQCSGSRSAATGSVRPPPASGAESGVEREMASSPHNGGETAAIARSAQFDPPPPLLLAIRCHERSQLARADIADMSCNASARRVISEAMKTRSRHAIGIASTP